MLVCTYSGAIFRVDVRYLCAVCCVLCAVLLWHENIYTYWQMTECAGMSIEYCMCWYEQLYALTQAGHRQIHILRLNGVTSIQFRIWRRVLYAHTGELEHMILTVASTGPTNNCCWSCAVCYTSAWPSIHRTDRFFVSVSYLYHALSYIFFHRHNQHSSRMFTVCVRSHTCVCVWRTPFAICITQGKRWPLRDIVILLHVAWWRAHLRTLKKHHWNAHISRICVFVWIMGNCHPFAIFHILSIQQNDQYKFMFDSIDWTDLDEWEDKSIYIVQRIIAHESYDWNICAFFSV